VPQSRHRQTTSKSDRQRAAIHRRLEMQRAHEAAERKAVRRRRGRRASLGVLAFLVVATPIGLVVWKRVTAPPPPPKLLSALVAKKAGKLAITSPPAAYRVRYKIDTYPTGKTEGSKPAATTEDILVRRPFDGRLVERSGAPPGDALQLDIRSMLGLRGDYSKADAVQVTSDAPAPAIGDMRLDASLDELVSGGFLEPRERRTVLGRTCQVYRTGLALESLSVSKASKDSYSDSCVDASGLLLEELSVSAGKLSTRVTAVEVDEHPDLPAGSFTIEGEPKGLEAGGVDLGRIDPSTPLPPQLFRFASPPLGFTSQGRFVLTVPDQDGTPRPRYLDVYANGKDLLLIEQGPKAAEPEPPVLPGTDVAAAALGDATIVPGLAGNILTAHPADDWFVKVTATLPPAALQQAVSGLTPG